MAKRKGLDVIEDAHEQARHNFHSSYWLNRVTSYTYATWMAQKKLSPLVLPILLAAWIGVISALTGKGAIWKALFIFRSAESTYRFVSFLLLLFYTMINIIAAYQVIFTKRQKPVRQMERKEAKKRQPKRRKDYK